MINIGSDDQREYITFYGLYTDDWTFSFGTFSNHQYILNRDYISQGCSTTDSSLASDTHEFLYPHHIKKTYYIEGVIEGEISLAAVGATATVTSYQVSVWKMNVDNSNEELATTGWITVNDTLVWDGGLGVGDEMVYHYWIDVWDEKELSENDRIFLKIEVNCDANTHLMHANDKTWTDVWIDIPFRL